MGNKMTNEKKDKVPAIQTVHDALHYIQLNLKAPKNQKNKFGGYNYRSCEDIVEAVKKIMPAGCNLIISDDIVMIGDRFYVKASARLCMGGECIESSAFAREAENKKGMDSAQVTGATSSYARKYALNGLFCIDDTRDADADQSEQKQEKQASQANPNEHMKYRAKTEELVTSIRSVQSLESYEALRETYDKAHAFFTKNGADKLAQRIYDEWDAKSVDLADSAPTVNSEIDDEIPFP